MSGRNYVLIAVLFVFMSGATAWSLSSHKDYAAMKIKECNACHDSGGVASNHGAVWVKEHRYYAEKTPNNCRDCHQQSYCMDCHYGGGIDADLHKSTSGPDYKPKSHRTDFRETHPIRAREDNRACYRCHDARNFCAECHSRFATDDLAVESHRRQFRDIRLSEVGPTHASFTAAQCQNCHVSGVLPKHEWTQTHSREARRNLQSCQACHPDGDVCMTCHSAETGLKINPHPSKWDKVKSRMSRASDKRTCLKCHVTVP